MTHGTRAEASPPQSLLFSTAGVAGAVVAAVLLLPAALSGQEASVASATSGIDGDVEIPTYYGQVQQALQRNCVACHRPEAADLGGMVAPMSLMTYDEARDWAGMIAFRLEEGTMPPWGAHIRHQGQFKDERYISAEDRETIITWARNGTPMGDPSDAPTREEILDQVVTAEPVAAPDGSMWWMGVPDMTVAFAEPLYVCDAIEDWQPRVRMHLQEEMEKPEWIRGMEIRPGSNVVHHTVSSHLGVGVPGRGPFVFPEGWGILLTENPYVSISMHYHKDPGPGTAVMDDTQGGFMFYEEGDVIDHVVQTELQPFTDFVIPPGDPSYAVRNTTHIEEDIYLLSMGPHAHYRGKAVKIELERPGSLERETLLWVPDYDFNWQFQYEYEEPYFIPAGSKMHITWWYDNSEANPYNPDPTQSVTYGAATTDEMMNARIYFAKAEPQGIVVGGEIPADILETSLRSEERAREQADEWEQDSEACPTTAGNVAGR